METWQDLLTWIATNDTTTIRPSAETISNAIHSLPRTLPTHGLGDAAVFSLVANTIAPATIRSSNSTYFGFVTGGSTPAALMADMMTSVLDQNVQVHLPKDSIATTVEVLALNMAAELMRIDPAAFTGKTVTTGATASNILGLACGREAVVKRVMEKQDRIDWAQIERGEGFSLADEGIFHSCRVVILHTHGHASLAKAASLLGIGRNNCINLGTSGSTACDFDLESLERSLQDYKRQNTGVVLVPSYGEVNTGLFTSHIPELRALCDKYGAWMHIDAAFGSFSPDSTHLHLADSITSDAHKWLNIPYDCGLFFTRSTTLLQRVCTPSFDLTTSGPAYLASSATDPALDAIDVASPLTLGIENSRRFRALPLYASLVSLGKDGYTHLFDRNLRFANRVARWIEESRDFVLLNNQCGGDDGGVRVSNIVLFCASAAVVRFVGKEGNARLVEEINGSREMYVTGTVWEGRAGVRLAVSNWKTGLMEQEDGQDPDFDVVVRVLTRVMQV
ncbi:hypothetical protein HDU98_011396 [Podochytrium sp. JEL0797]|nr:hypothetical protein HDU98_011396 [Podochytrium sp. JEL0797]